MTKDSDNPRPLIAEIRAERERSGDGLEICRRRLLMRSLETDIRNADSVADLRPVLLEMLRFMGHRE